MKICFLIILTLMFSFSCFETQAQEMNKEKVNLTGILALDSKNVPEEQLQINKSAVNFQTSSKKNRWLAGLFSLILPGSGEMYSGSYLKGAIFTVVEAAAITTALIYNHKGDNQTNFFQNYANQNWYVAKYAYWALKNAKNINPTVKAADYTDVFKNGEWAKLQNQDPSTINWQSLKADVDWTKLNQFESALGGIGGIGFTHQLVPQGEQQYYELIGKYRQYSHGWSTSNINDTDYHILTPQFTWYSHQRALANTFYQTGSTAVAFIYINHFLSVLDAIWTTDRYNKSLAVKFRVDQDMFANNVEFVPTIHLKFNF